MSHQTHLQAEKTIMMASDRKLAPVTRRNFLGHALLASASSALIAASGFPGAKGWLSDARAAPADATVDTFNGLLAFLAPGSDPYSTAQGVSTPEIGGVSVGATNILIATMDETTPFVPSFSVQVAAILNGLALVVNPAVRGRFWRRLQICRSPQRLASSRSWMEPRPSSPWPEYCRPSRPSLPTRRPAPSIRPRGR
jgi:hypothetical protein